MGEIVEPVDMVVGGFGAILTGFLGLMFLDIRNFRGETRAEAKAMKDEINNVHKRLDHDFLRVADHANICNAARAEMGNVGIRLEARLDNLEKTMESNFQAIKEAIRVNGSGRN